MYSGGLIAGVAEHHALIARALVGVFPHHALGDVRGLLVQRGQHRAGQAVEAVLGPVVADLHHLFAHDLLDGHVGRGGDLAHHHHHARGGAAFAGHMGLRVLFQYGVQHRVGDLVADLVRMSLSHRFGSEKVSHSCFLRLIYSTTKARLKSGLQISSSRLIFRLTPQELAPRRPAPIGCRASLGLSLSRSG